jgi:hypothetical protein
MINGDNGYGGAVNLFSPANSTLNPSVRINGAESDGAPRIRLYDTSGSWPQCVIDIDAKSPTGESRITTDVLEIRGADVSERFDVRSEPDTVEPGMVVSIDSDPRGGMVIAQQAYDRRVAGVVSGAGGVRVGMVMGQSGTVADGDHPVALAGRVYCWADASYGAIEPGDLLTTSDTPGHAMKARNHARAQGATLGKAMTSLAEGKGLVLVLVSLQ